MATVESTEDPGDHADGTSITLNMPSTRPDGNLYLAFVGCDGTGETIAETTTSAWTKIGQTSRGVCTLALFAMVGSSAAATYTFGTTSSQHIRATVMRISGTWASADAVSYVSENSGASRTSAPAPAKTNAYPTSLIIRAWVCDADIFTATAPTGHTLQFEDASDGVSCITMAIATSTTAGDTSGSATIGGSFSDGFSIMTVEVESATTVVLSGTAISGGVLESEIVSGGETIIATATGAEVTPA